MAEELKVPNSLITKYNLKQWGYRYVDYANSYCNWNGVWLRKKAWFSRAWEYGNPNWHTIDDEHPFIVKGEVFYLDELDALQRQNGGRGLEYKDYEL